MPSLGQLVGIGFTDRPVGSIVYWYGIASTGCHSQLAFKPTENVVPAGSTTTTSFTVSASDGIASPTLNAGNRCRRVIGEGLTDNQCRTGPDEFAIWIRDLQSSYRQRRLWSHGTVTFRLYDNATGTGTPIFTDTQALPEEQQPAATIRRWSRGTFIGWRHTMATAKNNSATSAANSPVLIATPIFVGGAYWYLGPGTVGSDLQGNRYVPGVKRHSGSRWRPGTQIGQATDGSVLVRNAAKLVFRSKRIAYRDRQRLEPTVQCNCGRRSDMVPRTDDVIGDPFIYRWADG